MRAKPFSDGPRHPIELTWTRLGASVTGVDLSQPLIDELRRQIIKTWHDHVILLFPGQVLTGAVQLEFAAIFGSIKKRGWSDTNMSG